MKSLRYRLTLILVLLSFSAFSQTRDEILEIQKETNVSKLDDLSRRHNLTEEIEEKKAIEFASKRGWPMIKIGPNGRISKLRGVTKDLQPIYDIPLDVNGNITVNADKLYTGGGLGLDLHGESMTVGVWDVGALRLTHQAYENRAIQKDSAIFDTLTMSKLSYAHPTAVAGQILASKSYNTASGAGQAQGVAYKSNVHGYDSNKDVSEVANAASQGLLFSNHSYVGSGYGSFYNVSVWDTIMYHAPYYLSIWSGGNIGGGPYDKLNNAAVTKNGLGVASIKNLLNYTGPGSVVISDGTDGSSFGPSDDGRIKPDISASGYFVRVTATRWDNDYTNGGGTSFASPTVAGTLLLLQQHYTNINGRFMRAATVKGLALHTALEAGPNPGPDIMFGWGLLNAEKAALAITGNGGESVILEDSLINGSTFSREFVASGNEPLVATICWTDLPGTNRSDNDTTRVLINDLDARLQSGGSTYFPWKLDWSNGKISAQGAALQGDNNRDNIEKIEIPSPAAGQVYTLSLNHKGALANNGQSFSLIVTGLEQCVVNRSISSPVNFGSSDRQQASSEINAINVISPGAEVIYHAANQVVMKDGFVASSGSTFRAYVEGCTTDYAARLRPVERPVVYYDIPRSDGEIELADNAVYPNPGNGIFNVQLDGLSEGKVEVVNSNGGKIFSKGFTMENEMNINIKDRSPGIYVIRIISNGKIMTKKIVKE